MPTYTARIQMIDPVTYEWVDVPSADMAITGDGVVVVTLDEAAQVGVGTASDHIVVEEDV